MRLILILLIYALTISVVTGNGLALAPGLSIKNALAYLAALMLLFQITLGRRLKFDYPGLHIAFATLSLYGLMSLLYVGQVVQPERYNFLASGIVLKSSLIDWAVVFFVFFYGTRTADDVERLIKALLIAVGICNLYTIAALMGAPIIGAEIVSYESGGARVSGVYGHANETGTLIAVLIPAYIAVAEGSRGFRRILWIGLLMCSVVVMFTTASRGALVALFLGGIGGMLLCRRYLSWAGAIKWATLSAAILVPVTIAVGVAYWDLLVRRFTGAHLGLASDLSSGRTDIWLSAFNKMLNQPITFITGYGWNVWPLMGFPYAAHNQYVSLWFELGAIGFICLAALLKQTLSNAAASLPNADQNGRRYMVACVFAVAILSMGLMFATLYIPWFFLWTYLGLSMRYASLCRQPAAAVPESPEIAVQVEEGRVRSRPHAVPDATGLLPSQRKTALSRSARNFD